MTAKWPSLRLEEISDLIDYGLTASAMKQSIGPKFLRITDIQHGEVDWSTVPYCKCDTADAEKHTLADGDIVFARTGATTGRSFLIEECPRGAVFASYLTRVRPKDTVFPGYLAWFFQTPSYWRQISKSSTGTAQPGVNSSKLKDLIAPLPPLGEQRRIAGILDKADAIRRKRQESIRLTEGFLRSLFLDMFGDPVTNPKGWPVVKLGSVLRTRPQIGTIQPAGDSGPYRIIRVGDLGDYCADPGSCKRIDLEAAEYSRFRVYSLDLLLARAIGSEQHLGKCSVCLREEGNLVFDSHVMRLQLGEMTIDASFLWQWMNSRGGRARFMQRAGRTAVQYNINAQQVVDIDIPLPPISGQTAFVLAANKVRTTGKGHRRSHEYSQVLVDSLTRLCFPGV